MTFSSFPVFEFFVTPGLGHCRVHHLSPTASPFSRHPGSSVASFDSVSNVLGRWAGWVHLLSLPQEARVTASMSVLVPHTAFSVAQSEDRAPAAPQRLSNKTSQPREIPISPFSPCSTLCFGCRARKPSLSLPIILIIILGYNWIEPSVWKLLLRTRRIERGLGVSELWKDSCLRPLGRDGSWFLGALVRPTGGCSLPGVTSALSGAMRRSEHCHFLPSLHYLMNTWARCSAA